MNKYFILLIIVFNPFSSTNVYAKNFISVSHGRYSDYYHIQYTLLKNNFIIPKNSNPEYSGQFEILLDKQNFPIQAKKCNGKLILRMPSTLSSDKNNKESIDKKLLLLEEITNVSLNKKESLDVIIELNPYITVVSKKPLEIQLTNCNIFFRAKAGMYVNHL